MLALKISADRPRIEGFVHLWAMYVRGFDPSVHCLPCLKGHRSTLVTRTMPCPDQWLEMAECEQFDYLYICGVTRNWSTNFHLAVRPRADTIAFKPTHNGFGFHVNGAEPMVIPELPDHYNGLSKAFTTCRNYQFGVAYYGPDSSASAAT